FYVLDNYAALRSIKPDLLAADAHLFEVKDALLYIQSQPLGGRGKSFQGESFYTAENPPFGATFTYYLKEALKTRKQQRQEAEKEAEKKKEAAALPSRDDLRAEEEEEPPGIVLTVADSAGRVVRRLNGPMSAGINRFTWDLRYPASTLPAQRPVDPVEEIFNEGGPSGPLVMPGRFTITLARKVNGVVTPLGRPQQFSVIIEGTESLPAADRAALVEFQQRVARLQRAVSGALETANSLKTRLGAIKRALQETPAADPKLTTEAIGLDRRTNEILRALRGDNLLRSRNENVPTSINERVSSIVGEQRMSTSRPTQTQVDDYNAAAQEFQQALGSLRSLIEGDLAKLEKAMESAGAPWTPGRIPEWKDN
ncbi:MAG TPA: glycosyl hydrolase, partial [Blastocatellia bacterium]|nr:glycosyl hydrolase [Blastocatellia bacterium]